MFHLARLKDDETKRHRKRGYHIVLTFITSIERQPNAKHINPTPFKARAIDLQQPLEQHRVFFSRKKPYR